MRIVILASLLALWLVSTPTLAQTPAKPAPTPELTGDAEADDAAYGESDMSDESAMSMDADTGGSDGAEPSERTVSEKVDANFFETRIRPVLVNHCYKCHSASISQPKGGLRVDSRDLLRRGGDSGAAVVPGQPAESLLLQALKYETYEMPPQGQLPDKVIADFETWIAAGAPDPRSEPTSSGPRKIDLVAGRQYWAFQPPRAVAPPTTVPADWAWGEIDRYILSRQHAEKLQPVSDADPATLLRRVYLDLVGFPPSPQKVDKFLADPSRENFAHIVDLLLDSPAFGERWGRHWLDTARYAESMGKTRNVPFPSAWRYRDFVIDAWNKDMPYDEFVRQQLAGDLLPAKSPAQREQQLVATGFLALGSHDLNERDRRAYSLELVSEQIDTTTRAFLGMTVACARCHDHKFDPIPQTDYYAMAGIFLSTDTRNGFTNGLRGRSLAPREDRLISLDPESLRKPPAKPKPAASAELSPEAQARVQAGRQQIAQLQARLQMLQRANVRMNGEQRQQRITRLTEQITQRETQLKRFITNQQERGPVPETESPVRGPVCMGVLDAATVKDSPLYVAGEPNQPGEIVPRGFLSVVQVQGTRPPARQSSGRLELAQWIADPDNPLTARVFVNRVWAHVFGRGIVSTVDNFGQTGSGPSHPELLDYLALRLVANHWSPKQLIREMVTSHTYALSSDGHSGNQQVDPDNQYLWRMHRKRLEFETLRDSILTVSGELNRQPPASTMLGRMPLRDLRRSEGVPIDAGSFPYRSVYLPIQRNRIPDAMMVFDFPEPSETVGQRDVTTVPTQALFFLNDPLVMQASLRIGRQLADQPGDTASLVATAYRIVLARQPKATELQRGVTFMTSSTATLPTQTPGSASFSAERWAMLIQALMASAEFRYAL